MSEKPRIKYIPRNGLHWNKQYAKVGDCIAVWPILRKPDFYMDVVLKVTKNRYGRISYRTTRKELVITEELTPLYHDGMKRMGTDGL